MKKYILLVYMESEKKSCTACEQLNCNCQGKCNFPGCTCEQQPAPAFRQVKKRAKRSRRTNSKANKKEKKTKPRLSRKTPHKNRSGIKRKSTRSKRKH